MTKPALRAAKAYLRKIDGDDFLDPEHGHDLKDLAGTIDREVCLPQLLAALEAAREPLEHAARFIAQFDRQPLKGTADEFYGIHHGTEFEASLKRSELRKAVLAAKLVRGALAAEPLHTFRQRVLNAWHECGAAEWVKSSHVAEKLQANETRVSTALVWLEENGYLK